MTKPHDIRELICHRGVKQYQAAIARCSGDIPKGQLMNRLSPWILIAFACPLLVMVGALGHWEVSDALTSRWGSGDRVLAFVLGIVALAGVVVLIRRPTRGSRVVWLPFSALALVVLAGLLNWLLVSTPAELKETARLRAGWGLILTTYSAVLGCGLLLVNRHEPGADGRKSQPIPPQR